MINQSEILKALQEGQDAGDIAQQFTEALNGAIAQNGAAARKAKEKEQKLQAIIDELIAFIDEFYPDFKIPEDAKKELSAKEFIAALDTTTDQIKSLQALIKDLDSKGTSSVADLFL